LLVLAGYLKRQFVGTISGGRKGIYSLTEQGARLVGVDPETLKRHPTQFRQGEYYFEHQLSLNQIYLSLRQLNLSVHGCNLRRYRIFNQQVMPGLPLIPDALGELETPRGIRACFIEADLGTETRKIIRQKVEAYFSLAISGEFERIFGQPQFRVLLVTTTERRLKHLQAVIRQKTDKLFYLTTFEDIKRSGVIGPIWLRPSGDERCSL
jgi:hypothetical protein